MMAPAHRPDVAARRRRGALAAASLGVMVSIAALDHLNALPGSPDRCPFDRVDALVVRIVDGETLVLDPSLADNGAALEVRLWGVRAPAADGGVVDASLARDAAALLERLAAGQSVTVLTERSRIRDERGRLLAHVIADGDTLGAALVGAGLTAVDGRWRHRDSDRFAALELAARRARRGMWADAGEARP